MPQARILIIHGEPGDDEARRFEDALQRRLCALGGEVVAVPSLVSMPDDHPALAELRRLAGPLVCVSWLHSRACQWLKAYRGVDDADACLRLGDYDTPEAAAEAVARAARLPGKSTSLTLARDLSADEGDAGVTGRWYPVLDYEACVDCKQCYDFCLFGVYSLDESDRVIVVQPDACKPGCVACARLCPAQAILFPLHEAHPWIAGGPGERPEQDDDLAEYFGDAAEDVAARLANREVSDTKPCPAAGSGTCEGACCSRGKSSRDDLDDLIDALDDLDV